MCELELRTDLKEQTLPVLSTIHRLAYEVLFMHLHKEMWKPYELGFAEMQFLHQETIKESLAATGLLHNRIRHFNELLLVHGSSALLICNEAGHCYRNHANKKHFWMYLRRWVWIEMQTVDQFTSSWIVGACLPSCPCYSLIQPECKF